MFGAVGGWKPYGSRVNPDPPGGGESPAGAIGVDLLRQEPGKQVSRHDPCLGDRPTVSTTLPPQAQKPWACTRSRLSFPDRLADVRSAVPSKSFGVDVRMVQPVLVWSAYADDNPSRPAEADENAMPGLAPAAVPGLDPVELVVDGESFVVTRRADSPGTYDFDWISHPASYGFTIGANFEWRPGQAELTEEIHHFLADVDPKTGYLAE